jgi:hypothetical protein
VSASPSNPINVLLCSHVLDKGSWCTVDLWWAWPSVESCGVESCDPPTPKPLNPPPPHPSHFRLSLLAAWQWDGLGWSTPRRPAHSQIRDQRMPDIVSVYCDFFVLTLVLFSRLFGQNANCKYSILVSGFTWGYHTF